MFIHWGLYALPAGVWNGEGVPGIGEWIMHRRRIPRAEYGLLADRFQPTKFDAKQWVSLAVEAGMRYLVITAKHHDGFAMFKSPCCSYNVADATPWGRDPILSLAEECGRAGLKLGFYYSQDQDWHDPDGSANDWDFDESGKDFDAYLKRKVVPQLRELLTQYGPIGLIWFDTPYTISPEDSQQLADLVHQLQPDCLVSGRIGNNVGDYGSLGDNQIPAGLVRGDYETPATLNDTWGFKSTDHNWKTASSLVQLLVDLASKGVNYLLNVGPTAEGGIPGPSVARLKEIGSWIAINGDAIYGTLGSPFPYELPGLRLTRRGRRLYLMLMEAGAGTVVIHGLQSTVVGAHALQGGRALTASQRTLSGGVTRLQLEVDSVPDALVPVVVIDLDSEPRVDTAAVQQPDGSLTLHAHTAQVEAPGASDLEVLSVGVTAGWYDANSSLEWDLKLHSPGTFDVELVVYPNHDTEVVPEHGFRLTVGTHHVEGTLRDARPAAVHTDARTHYFPEYSARLGTMTVDAAGLHHARLHPTNVVPSPDGATVLNLVLRPVTGAVDG